MQEKQLLKACLEGNDIALRKLYETHKVRLFMICLRYSRDRSEAEDILQEGFIKIFKDLKQYSGKGSLAGWMRKVMVHTALNQLRKRKGKYTFIEEEDAGAFPPSEDITFSRLSAQEITAMIQQLPDGYRTVFNLYGIEGYTHKEIAEMLGISESTSKTQLFKAKRILKKKLESFILN
ncbi:MAG: RNA polymerase sigma factor [Bacteroidota bacterium]